jgi:hypothetical protein
VLDCFDTISFSGFHRMDNLLKCHTYTQICSSSEVPRLPKEGKHGAHQG